MKYYVYRSQITPFKAAGWKAFDSIIAAKLFMKINGYKLLAKGK